MAEPMMSARDYYVRGTDDPPCQSDSDWFHYAEQYAAYVTAARDLCIAALKDEVTEYAMQAAHWQPRAEKAEARVAELEQSHSDLRKALDDARHDNRWF